MSRAFKVIQEMSAGAFISSIFAVILVIGGVPINLISLYIISTIIICGIVGYLVWEPKQ